MEWAKLGGAWDFGVKGAVKEVIPVVLVFNHDLPEHYCDWACLHQKNIIVKFQAMNNTKPQGSQL